MSNVFTFGFKQSNASTESIPLLAILMGCVVVECMVVRQCQQQKSKCNRLIWRIGFEPSLSLVTYFMALLKYLFVIMMVIFYLDQWHQTYVILPSS